MTKKVEESTVYDNFMDQKVILKEPATLVDVLDLEEEDKEWEQHWVEMPEYEQENQKTYKKNGNQRFISLTSTCQNFSPEI